MLAATKQSSCICISRLVPLGRSSDVPSTIMGVIKRESFCRIIAAVGACVHDSRRRDEESWGINIVWYVLW